MRAIYLQVCEQFFEPKGNIHLRWIQKGFVFNIIEPQAEQSILIKETANYKEFIDTSRLLNTEINEHSEWKDFKIRNT